MARKKRTPGYCQHRPSGQAYVRMDGSKGPPTYLGAYGSTESRQEYERLISLWHAEQTAEIQLSTVTIVNLCVAYLRHCKTYYRKDGEETSEVSAVRSALRVLKNRYGSLPACEFSPKKLNLVREDMIGLGWVRKSINRQIDRIVLMLKWGKSQELVVPAVHESCKDFPRLEKGRSNAVEGQPVLAVPDDRIMAIRPHVPRQIWAMICLQLQTGMRPGEVRTLRMQDLDVSDPDLWEYIPARHKTEHHGRERRVFLNRSAQAVLRSGDFIADDSTAYLFSPHEAYKESQAKRVQNAVGPSTAGKRKLTRKPRKAPGSCYSKDSYNRAIARACEVAFKMPEALRKASAEDTALKAEAKAWRKQHCWSPGQLRHNAASVFAREFDDDTARTILGHSSVATSAIYIERDFDKARAAMKSLDGDG